MTDRIDINKQRKLGVLLGYVNYAIKMIAQLVYVPIMLRLLGQSEYGVYQLVASIIAYLGLLSFGFGGAYLRFFSQCKGDKAEEARLNGTFMLVFCFFSILALIAGGILTLNTDVVLGNKLSSRELEIAHSLFLILTINMALTFPISVFSSIVTAYESFIFQKVVDIISSLANPFLNVALLMLGKGSIGLVLITTALTVFSGIINFYYVVRKLKVRFCFRKLHFSLVKDIGAFSFFIFLNSIIDQINWNIDKYILGRMVGTISIAVYSIGAQINTIYVQLSDMTAIVMAPKVNKIVANGENIISKLNTEFIKVGRIQAYIVLFIVSGFVVLGRDFILLWAGTSYEDAYVIALLLIIPAAIPLVQSLGIDIQRAMNKHQIRAIVYAALSIVNVLISIPLVYMYGATGAALGTALSLLFGNGLLMNIIYKKYIGLDVLKFWKNVLPILPVVVIPSISVLLINHINDSVSWIMFLGKGVIFVVIYCLATYILSMNIYEKNIIKSTFEKHK